MGGEQKTRTKTVTETDFLSRLASAFLMLQSRIVSRIRFLLSRLVDRQKMCLSRQ